MPIPAIGALATAAINAIRGASTLGRMIRVGRRVFRMLDSDDPKNNFRPQIDIVRTSRSFSNIVYEMNRIAGTPSKMGVDHMKRGAGNLAGDVAMLYPPFKDGEAASFAKIDSDINKIFKPLESIPFGELVMSLQFSAAAAYNFDAENKTIKDAIAQKNWSLVFEAFQRQGWRPTKETVTVVGVPNRALHNSAMTRNGVVKKTFFVSGPRDKAKAEIENYAKSVKKMVGKMAGGWVKCYMSLGGRGRNLNPSYATIGKGEFSVIINKSQIGVRMSNRYGNFNGYMSKRMPLVNTLANRRMNETVELIERDLKREIERTRLPR